MFNARSFCCSKWLLLVSIVFTRSLHGWTRCQILLTKSVVCFEVTKFESTGSTNNQPTPVCHLERSCVCCLGFGAVEICSKSCLPTSTIFELTNVKKKNCRIWSVINLYEQHQYTTHPEKVPVWCGFWPGGISSYFFKN